MITYITIKVEHLDSIDFSQIIESRKDSVRKSNDDSEFVAKWQGDMPETILNVPEADRSAELTHAECLELMNTPEWVQEPE